MAGRVGDFGDLTPGLDRVGCVVLFILEEREVTDGGRSIEEMSGTLRSWARASVANRSPAAIRSNRNRMK
jgi:hypothetical protein